MDEIYSKGLHILLTLKTESKGPLINYTDFEIFTKKTLERFDTEIVGITHHIFENQSFTASFCLKESHLCIHTWPEFNQLTFDIFLCNYINDNTNKVEDISKEFVHYFNADILQEDKIYRQMNHVCPFCKTNNEINLKFKVEEYICSSCAKLIDISKNTAGKVVKKPVTNVILDVGQKGILEGKEYTVISIVVRKYGSSTLWREYVLKNSLDENLYLSESYGHWVLLKEENIEFTSQKKSILYNGLLYRLYETTPNSIESATGYFEEKLSFALATYVYGTKMISYEHHGSRKEFFAGKHIPFKLIQKAFNTNRKPNKYGIGIVQPYYINIKQLLNIFGVSAILIALLQLFNYTTKTNYEVLNDVIRFDSITNKELVSKSFALKGGSAPMNVKLFQNVDNSWANVELSLVNEITNEITYTSKDIERYSGYEGGENWSEGNNTEEFNLCGVPPGKYHFIISAQKQGSENINAETRTYSDGNKTITQESDGLISVKDNLTGNYTTYADETFFKKDSPNLELLNKLKDSAKVIEKPVAYDTTNPTVEIKAVWKPR